MKSLIKKLVETVGPSGYESKIRAVIQAEIEGHVDDMRVDALGNLITRKGKEGGLKVMLAAHMDEIGVMVTHVDEDGFVRFTNIGGVYPRNCVGGHVRFLNDTVGVIQIEREDDRRTVPPLEKMYIDVGAKNRKGCPVKVGDIAVFERPFLDLGDRLVSKAMDDRIGVALLVETLRQMKETPYQVFFVFSAQEEVGTRGAITAAYGVNPDIGLAADVTLTGDTPKSIKMEVSVGKGPAIKVRDSGMLSDPRIVDWMAKTAQKAKIPYQLEVLDGGSTDARSIQVNRAGVPTGCISIPCRYVHTPSEMVDYGDVQEGVRLLVELLRGTIPAPQGY
jgi:endoglucanase